MSSSTPSTLGKYQIIREIARSNDIVYEAYDPLMNRRVALKELAMPGGATSQQKEDRVKRFLREARAAGSLQHPNIMTVFEVGEEAGRYFIAMEYLDGKTLRNELDTKGFLEPDRALEIAHGVLDALTYAHSKGVIHRDIKPDNIQLISNGGIKLTDFGIARLTFEPNLTIDGQVFGTPSYMSPEQVVGREIDQRSDLFSVGIVLYEMLSGAKPFPGDSVVAITYSIMNKHPDRPQQVNYALWQVIERSLDKSPQLRYRDAPEFSKALTDAARASASVVIDPRTQASPPPAIGQPYGGPGSAVPAPPVLHAPYGGPSGAAQGPYGPPPQAGSPYGSNPYATSAPYGGPGAAMPSPYTHAPIYYPPPPRGPMIKPAVRKFLGQLLASVIALSAVMGILILAVNWFGKVSDRRPAAERASSKTATAPQDRSGRASATTPGGRMSANAQGLWNSGQYEAAEKAYREAVRLEPKNAEFRSDLAAALFISAEREANSRRQAELYEESAKEYAKSAELEPVAKTKARVKINAAEAYYRSALLLAQFGRASEARDQLWEARRLAEADARLYGEIERLRLQLSTYR